MDSRIKIDVRISNDNIFINFLFKQKCNVFFQSKKIRGDVMYYQIEQNEL